MTMTPRDRLHRIMLLPLTIALTLPAARLSAQETKKSAGPNYPRVNLATTYEVDPHWPKKPSHFEWGAMSGIAVDKQDRVYAFTRAKPPVQVYDADGNFLTAWGEAEIGRAHHIKVGPDGTIWLTDIDNHVVMQFTPEGKLLKTLGTRGEKGEDSTHLNMPTDMAVTPAGDVFVSDGYGNNRVVHFDKEGRYVKSWGKLGTRPGEFSVPHGIALDSKGRLYVADRNNARVQVFDQAGKFLAEWRDLIVPWGFAVTPKDEIWVCGSSPSGWVEGRGMLGVPPKDQVFMKFDTSGKVLQMWTVPLGVENHARPGDCIWVHGMAVDSKGNLYAGDIMGKRAQKFVRQK
jgi:DNA-binding beta-propeller fold protein YncE